MGSLRFTLLWLALALPALAEEPPKISIPDLLNPQKQEATLLAYLKKAYTVDVPACGHIHVSRLQSAGGAERYLATWIFSTDRSDAWGQTTWEALDGEPAASEKTLRRQEHTFYQIFSADGQPTAPMNGTTAGVVADLNGDGAVEIAELQENSFIAIPGLQIKDHGLQVSVLEVRSAENEDDPAFAVLLNTHPKEKIAANSWSWQLRWAEKTGSYEIDLGPAKYPQAVERQVTFRWDREKKSWSGPDGQPGDHFRVIHRRPMRDEVAAILNSGGLGYPLEPVRKGQFLQVPGPVEVDRIPKDQLSKPYRYQSMAGKSPAEIFAAMTGGHSKWDYEREKGRELTTVPDFWTVEAQEAAMALVQRNRWGEKGDPFALEFYNPEHLTAPEEGELILSDGPSGCFAPEGSYTHYLHCAREKSYLVRAELIWNRFAGLTGEAPAWWEFRRAELSYEEARHVLQTVWWLSRIRSTRLTMDPQAGGCWGGSTSDGFATIDLVAGSRVTSLSGSRVGGWFSHPVAFGESTGDYEPSSCINLTVRIFGEYLPARLGERWNPPITGLAEVQNIVRDLFKGAVERHLPLAAVKPFIELTGSFGWHALRPEIEAISAALPALSEYEKKKALLETDLRGWEAKLGQEATEGAFCGRELQRDAARRPSSEPSSAPAIPGLETIPSEPLTAEEEARFGEFDTFYREYSDLIRRGFLPENAIARVRVSLEQAKRQLDAYDHVDALLTLAQANPKMLFFVATRLPQLDHARALEFLRQSEKLPLDDFEKHLVTQAREYWENNPPGAEKKKDRRLEKEERTALLARFRDFGGRRGESDRALGQLVPPEDPQRDPAPEIDAALLEVFDDRTEGHDAPFGTAMAIAQRLRGRGWDALWARGGEPSGIRNGHLSSTFPALVRIAQLEPDPYRQKIAEVVAKELEKSPGPLNEVFTAIWLLDLREFAPVLETLATSGPEDFEAGWAVLSANTRLPMTDFRFHGARRVLSVWKEEDAATRVKLLVALALREEARPGFLDEIDRQLVAQRDRLNPAQRDATLAFIRWCEANAAAKLREKRGPMDPAEVVKITSRIRGSLLLPP